MGARIPGHADLFSHGEIHVAELIEQDRVQLFGHHLALSVQYGFVRFQTRTEARGIYQRRMFFSNFPV